MPSHPELRTSTPFSGARIAEARARFGAIHGVIHAAGAMGEAEARAAVEAFFAVQAIRLRVQAAAQGARLVVFPEAFIPGSPIWIDTRPIWDGDRSAGRTARR